MAAAASIGTPLHIKERNGPALEHFTGIFFGDLVNEDALGVDVLGPRLAVEGHLLLRKKWYNSVKGVLRTVKFLNIFYLSELDRNRLVACHGHGL